MRPVVFSYCILGAMALGWSSLAAAPKAAPDFDRTIAPLFVRRCLECHSGATPKGGLNLTSAKKVLGGGDSGRVLAVTKPEESLLWQRVRDNEMPPKKALGAEEKELLRAWIAAGAKWGADPIDPFAATTDKRAGYDWWSLRPVVRPPLPDVHNRTWIRAPVDAFILQRLEARGLAPSPEADRRTLIRRLYFDLIGLPPSPEEIQGFVADSIPLAYERLVDRLLASPHYGERWARHWLDIVRFGESDGFERDLPRANAWPYRDWVVGALNRDLPYDEFVRLQIAGDVLRANDPTALAATGFLVAGPHDIVLPVGERMKTTMRQDEMEDLIGAVGQTFLGLTVNCARCHDHKFDPITQKDYYRLTASLAGVNHGERNIPNPSVQAEVVRLQTELDRIQRQIAALDDPVRQAILTERKNGQAAPVALPIAEWRFANGLKDPIGGLHGRPMAAAHADRHGLHVDGKAGYIVSEPLAHDLKEKTLEAWVQLDSLSQQGGGVIGIETVDGTIFDSIVFAEREPRRWMAGSNGFVRTQSFNGPLEMHANQQLVHVAITYAADGTITGFRDGVPYGRAYKADGPIRYAAGAARAIFGIRHEPPGGNRMLAGLIFQARLYDRALSPNEVARSSGVAVTEQDILKRLSPPGRQARQRLQQSANDLQKQIDGRKPLLESKMYAVVAGSPPPTHLLLRGQVDAKGEPLGAGGVKVASPGAGFELPTSAPDSDRRLALARWISDPANPLFARVIVNRLWHYHFGFGLVDTPNDFGFNGGRPSHPELLDWLASELVRENWRLKALHRQLVLSATYRQSSRSRAEPARIDADNRLLWRMSPHRLEAEALRDSMVAVAGDLDRTIGGKGYADTRSFFFKGTQYYDPIDQVGPQFNRRTLYRMWARGGRSPFLDTFDCPDPSTTTPRRTATTTPVQALALMNNAFVLHMADRLSDRVQREAGADVSKQVARACWLAYGREPDAQENVLARAFISRHGLPAFCRVLFNSNEFVQVD